MKSKELELLKDIDALIEYIQNVTGGNFESCAVFDICQKYK